MRTPRRLQSLFFPCLILFSTPFIVGADETISSIDGQLVPGTTFSRTATGKHAVSYHVYLPTSFEPSSDPPPILVAFSPGGEGKKLLEQLQPAAESAGWLLVGCDELRNGMQDETLEVEMEDEVLDDLFKNVPHDPARVYLGGFSGGAMRAYGITARRSEPYAGILAYGGWLGGPDYQDKSYRKNMSVAMLTGTRDLGASGWVPIDTRTLRKRNCAVKHYSFVGGHQVAPPAVTEMAIGWLNEQWDAGTQEDASPASRKIPLKVLYVGEEGPRADDFIGFLSNHFVSVTATLPNALTLDLANRADVLLLDAVVRSLPEGYTKAMLMTGSSAAMTSERYGSKIDWLCQCLDNEAYLVNTSHPIFEGPLSVTPTLVEKRCPHSKLKIKAWKVEEPQERPGLVSSRKHFASSKDSEIISGGVNMKGVSGVPLVREAHRLLWGFVASPKDMTQEGQRVFVNALAWIHRFDGEVQTVFAGLHKREEIDSVLKSPYVNSGNLNRWFPAKLIEQTGGDKEKVREHFAGRMAYVYAPTGSGQLQIDEEAEQLGTPNNDPASIAKWIELLDGDQEKLGFRLLQRYTQQRIRRKAEPWREWFEKNKELLRFNDERGYRFFVKQKNAEPSSVKRALLGQGDGAGLELSEVSPVVFERGLDSLHLIDGVAHQYCGWKITLVIRARVKESWHFYSASEDNGTNIPTKIEVDLPEGMQFVDEWKYPESEHGELVNGATFERVIRVGDEPVDLTEIKGSIRFQACTAEKCLRPQTLNFTLPITVMAK